MKVIFEVKGLSCDLALHPISEQTANTMRKTGSSAYGEKYMHWWRRGTTRTFGMRITEYSHICLYVDDAKVDFNAVLLYRNVHSLQSRMYLTSKAHYLALLGYDDETCTFRWIWNDVKDFDPEKFDFAVTDWDNILNTKGYRVLDTVLYDGRHADGEEWLDPSGFTLIKPQIIDLQELRKEFQAELYPTKS